jgi:hypothetical protein
MKSTYVRLRLPTCRPRNFSAQDDGNEESIFDLQATLPPDIEELYDLHLEQVEELWLERQGQHCLRRATRRSAALPVATGVRGTIAPLRMAPRPKN